MIPAATLILMRDVTVPSEILMVERGARLAFAPGAMVFPGGRIEPDDLVVGRGSVEAAAVAAIRETLEETGLAVALDPMPDGASASVMRAELHAGARFSELLRQRRMTLRLDDLLPFARWCPTFHETRNFDTHFFLARAPAGVGAPIADATESVDAYWTTAADVLARADAGAARIIFPTRRNLKRLAQFATFEEAARDARAHSVATIVPWVEDRGGEDWLCIPEDRGYPVLAERLSTVMRG